MYERYAPIKNSSVRYTECVVGECCRQWIGAKEKWQFAIEETCLYGQNGNNSCPYKRNPKLTEEELKQRGWWKKKEERKPDVRAEPSRTEA